MSDHMTPDELEKFIHRELRALPPRRVPAGFELRVQAAVEARAATRTADQLERIVHRELQSLPLRKAPATLEARVLAAIEHRQSVPWWHKSWSYWPTAVKAGFATLSTGVVAAVVFGLTLLERGPEAAALAHQVSQQVQGVSSLLALGTWVVDFTGQMLGNIPALWLYGGFAAIAGLYATFFGLGAVAYRTIYRTN
jgi:hypothetical protein